LKLKVDDAVCACRAAREEGVVEGGGYALYTIANDPRLHPITQEALRKPYEMILKNAGIGAMGTRVNVKTKEEVSDFFVEGIIDPAKVVRCSVENAVSFAGMLLTISSATVYYDRESKETVV
jgi:chaperonin GroEL